MTDWLIHIDTKFFLFLNSFNSPFFDNVMWHISGKWEWLPLYAILLWAIINRYRQKSIAVVLAIVAIIALADMVSSQLIKESVARLRPSNAPELEGLVHIVNGYRGGRYGFVSSHAANSFALAVFLSVLFKKKWFTLSIFLWALLVSYSRIYLGVHYPGDILGGALLGAFSALLVYYVYALYKSRFEKKNAEGLHNKA
ncbi:MAG: phosphatase PAP2 family protein [Bacteroidales bacterium]|nr:phosphatase PAP2 family protein [Bacteroidales bacterium]